MLKQETTTYRDLVCIVNINPTMTETQESVRNGVVFQGRLTVLDVSRSCFQESRYHDTFMFEPDNKTPEAGRLVNQRAANIQRQRKRFKEAERAH